MLISQHNALLGNEKTLTGMIGTIDQQCDILAVCEDAFSAASIICDRYLVRVATILNLFICNDHRSSIDFECNQETTLGHSSKDGCCCLQDDQG